MLYLQEGTEEHEHDPERNRRYQKTQIKILEKNIISEMENHWIGLTTN